MTLQSLSLLVGVELHVVRLIDVPAKLRIFVFFKLPARPVLCGLGWKLRRLVRALACLEMIADVDRLMM